MKAGKKITAAGIFDQQFKNWFVMRNAHAQQATLNGFQTPALTIENARAEYKALIKNLAAFANPLHADHNRVFAALKNDVKERSPLDSISFLANGIAEKLRSISDAAMKNGATPEQASAVAMNSFIGNPGYDQFANIGFISGQLFEQKTFRQSFLEEGDAYQLPTEYTAAASAISRFRVPIAQVSGSAKTRLGDLNPWTSNRLDAVNPAQVSIVNEFKDARGDYSKYIIDEAQKEQAVGYARSAGLVAFVLQSMFVEAYLELVEKNAEIAFVDGWDAGTYIPNVGGTYGLLSPEIVLALSDAGAASPALASGADWDAAPTKLLQQIVNFNYKPADVNAPLAADANVTDVYADIVRLLNLVALTNVVTGSKVVLYVPTSFYALAVNYLGAGTFNRQLDEAITKATSGIVKKVEVKTSGLMGARTNSNGVAQVNHIVAIVHGAPNEKKGVIAPMVTATAQVSSGNISQQRIEYAADLQNGGPMFLQLGQAFDLAFSVQA